MLSLSDTDEATIASSAKPSPVSSPSPPCEALSTLEQSTRGHLPLSKPSRTTLPLPTMPPSLTATTRSLFRYSILVANFFAPWCRWSNLLKPSWEKAAKIIKERYDPEMDGWILLGKVDCTQEGELCRRHHIQGYPSIRIFRKGSDVKLAQGLTNSRYVKLTFNFPSLYTSQSF